MPEAHAKTFGMLKKSFSKMVHYEPNLYFTLLLQKRVAKMVQLLLSLSFTSKKWIYQYI